MQNNNQKVLASFYWDYYGHGCVEGLFICTVQQIKDIQGKFVYFGEILGKYSEVSGKIQGSDISIVSSDEKVIEILLGAFPDGNISGYNPLDFVDLDEEEEE